MVSAINISAITIPAANSLANSLTAPLLRSAVKLFLKLNRVKFSIRALNGREKGLVDLLQLRCDVGNLHDKRLLLP